MRTKGNTRGRVGLRFERLRDNRDEGTKDDESGRRLEPITSLW